MYSASAIITVPFHDVDVMTVAWHGHYAKYCELARTALAQRLGIDWPTLKNLGYVMPIVHFSCDYRLPLEYGTEYEVMATVEDPFLPAFEIAYEIRRTTTGRVHAWAKSKQVYVNIESKEISFVIPKPVEEILRMGVVGELKSPGESRAEVFWRC